MKILKDVEKPSDLKNLNDNELDELCREIREEIISVVSKRGGHLAPSLGVVELTLGVHLALDCPKDKIVWDVGHQCYTHKIITGRKKAFPTLRSYKGISGFPRCEESEYDTANTGHASTAISTALGLAKARDVKGEDRTIVAVVGDGSLTGGLAYEGLNQAGHLKTNLIVVLNDNEMSIDKNVGALSAHLNRIRNDEGLNKVKNELRAKMAKIPTLGPLINNIGESAEEALKNLLVPGKFFEELGFRYIGPINGHDIEEVKRNILFAKKIGGPILVHARTIKGKGYVPAEEDPNRFHGTPPFDRFEEKLEGAKKPNGKVFTPTYTEVFGSAITELAKENKHVVAITAAMTSGTGLELFAKEYPKRFFDVGIAEEHAVTFAAGLAAGGLRPVVAIYSTFLQRGYDQLIHDIALTGLPVVFALDRAGFVGEDGPTHHGVFDLSYLKNIPGMTILAPSDEQELRDMLYTAISLPGPVAIRYPRGKGPGTALTKFKKVEIGKAKILEKGSDVLILAVGRMVTNAKQASVLLKKEDISATVVDVMSVRPFDKELFSEIIPLHKLVVTMEENVMGGFGESIAEFMSENDYKTPSLFCHIPDRFMAHGAVEDLMKDAELDAESVAKKILAKVKRTIQTVK